MDALKAQVMDYLAANGEASAKEIAAGLGVADTAVINALNALQVYEEVESTYRGRKLGFSYKLRETSDASV